MAAIHDVRLLTVSGSLQTKSSNRGALDAASIVAMARISRSSNAPEAAATMRATLSSYRRLLLPLGDQSDPIPIRTPAKKT